MIRALIFDFDGLILDTELTAFQSWQEVYEEHNCALPLEEWAKCIGNADLFDPVDYLETLLGSSVAQTAIREKRRRRHMELISALSALPGVEEYLHTAQQLGLKLAVASSSPREWVTAHLSRLHLLSFFDILCCGDEVTRKKPDPELFLTALEKLGVRSEQAIVFEDSPNGVRAANRAGIFCVAVPNLITGQLPLDHADMRLKSMAEKPLLELIAEVERSQQLSEPKRA